MSAMIFHQVYDIYRNCDNKNVLCTHYTTIVVKLKISGFFLLATQKSTYIVSTLYRLF